VRASRDALWTSGVEVCVCEWTVWSRIGIRGQRRHSRANLVRYERCTFCDPDGNVHITKKAPEITTFSYKYKLEKAGKVGNLGKFEMEG